jgi:subtilisin family serine protease
VSTATRRLAQPWARASALYAQPNRLIVKLRLGESPDKVLWHDPKLGVGPVDRVLSHYADGVQCSRAYVPAAGRWDDLEHATGLARTYRVRGTDDLSVERVVDALRSLEVVESVSPQYLTAVPMEVATGAVVDERRAWATRDAVNGPVASAYEAGDAAVIVAILDTGIVEANEEFGPNVRDRGPDYVRLGDSDFARGLELIGDARDVDVNPVDEVGHGTACAAIIGGRGTQLPPGIAAGCTVLPTRVLGSARMRGRKERVGVGRISDIDEGVKAAVDLGAKVLNMSFGTPVDDLDAGDPVPHADVIDYALARGCILVAASGNSGQAERFTPSCLDGVVAVGAVDDDSRPCSFSTSGPHVALCAPGWKVPSLGLDGPAAVSGTSFAAPFVAAVAALLASRANRRAYELDGPAAARIMRASARPWSKETTGHGAGTLDALAALQTLEREIDRAESPSTTHEGE